ncbi:MAG: hypothetical protein H0V96_01080 [Acidimicrobiia bacterium]|nr:hypothetical protein [Acidimicrobiia bacterium]
MSNLTLKIDAEMLKRARIRALDNGTSVNALVRQFLEDYAGTDDRRRAVERFLDIGARATTGSDGRGRTWERDSLYQERSRWPHS